jgi:glutathione synthase/RimK-type ligase-like ATP-grasp enzyme
MTGPAVALATCAAFPDLEADDRRLVGLLRERGVPAQPAVWDDPAVDWPSFRLVVVRSTWDYPSKPEQFLTWAARLPRVLNPSPVLRWNADKRYLLDLAAAVPVVPTRFIGPGDAFELPAGPLVVKPAISCGGRDTARYNGGHRAGEHIRRLQAEGRTAMLQPYLAEVEQQGEVDLVFLGGRYSHAVRRGALLAGGKKNTGEGVRPYEATAEQLALAEKALGLVPGDPSLLYARVDLLPSAAGPVLLELELLEPSLFLGYAAGSGERLADLIAAATQGAPAHAAC